MRRLLQGQELEARARELGVSLNYLVNPNSGTSDEPELQRRVLEAERARRESWLWLVALLSAAASIVSAVAAWVAVARI
ncbi:MAG: hypothetical protein Q8S43_08125 [Actinomycetota bacterium]|nr:hypothetical protein [Actinomycetota bacterium]MDP3630898.1 hypothetical protein [Actinomycetota bacterium]